MQKLGNIFQKCFNLDTCPELEVFHVLIFFQALHLILVTDYTFISYSSILFINIDFFSYSSEVPPPFLSAVFHGISCLFSFQTFNEFEKIMQQIECWNYVTFEM